MDKQAKQVKHLGEKLDVSVSGVLDNSYKLAGHTTLYLDRMAFLKLTIERGYASPRVGGSPHDF